ncbi:putative retrotransposon Copia-like protein [Helianthus annuus]|nr:putative retrotransposon Copia-like protein [Helianthus annuus]
MQVNDALSDKNYADWVQEMENFLFAKNKIGFIDGSIKKPETTSKDYMAWMRSDAMIKGWLTTAMEKIHKKQLQIHKHCIRNLVRSQRKVQEGECTEGLRTKEPDYYNPAGRF